MAIRILNADAVRASLSMNAAIDAVRDAYVSCSKGTGLAPDRVHLELPGEGNVALFMPGFMTAGDRASLVVKTVTVFPDNPSRGLPMNQGALLAVSAETGEACGLLDTASVTSIRTAAGSGAATDALARPDASVLAMLGTGVLGPTHIEAVRCVRNIEVVRIWGRTPANAEALAAGLDDVEVSVHDTADEAVRGADVVCTATPATAPLFDDASIAPGTHVNAVGAFRPTMCELPAALLARASVYIDQHAAAVVEAGDIIQAVDGGAMTWDDVAGEIGEVIAGTAQGRASDDEVTVFKSVGMSLQDAAAAAAALACAEANDVGQVIAWP